MPYKPVVRGAGEPEAGKYVYRLGGNSCLSGDFVGDFSFDQELQAGDKLVFEDMIHYTIVKTTMFNGVSHPDLLLWRMDGRVETLRRFGYADYKSRMD
jgi:carboxynorspermidine decarboxylase